MTATDNLDLLAVLAHALCGSGYGERGKGVHRLPQRPPAPPIRHPYMHIGYRRSAPTATRTPPITAKIGSTARSPNIADRPVMSKEEKAGMTSARLYPHSPLPGFWPRTVRLGNGVPGGHSPVGERLERVRALAGLWAMRWKPALNAFAITFNGRITPTGNQPMRRSDPPLIGQPL